MRLELTVSRFKRLIIYLFFCIFFTTTNVNCQENEATAAPPRRPPSNFAATGKLNQFSGFYTPRPLPSNANFVYASIWASWSAWSFCANNVQIRVRACNTVRGFTCPGPNQERKPCGQALQTQGLRPRFRPNGGFGSDYDAVDPWEEDRREALKQLYSDYTPPEGPGQEQSKRGPAPPLRTLGKSLKPEKPQGGDFVAVQRSPGRTAQVGGGYGHVPLAPLQPPPESDFNRKLHSDGPGQAPSMTPELLFGSKLEIPPKRIKSASSESKEQKLEGISAETKDKSIETTKSASSEVTTLPKIPEPEPGKIVPSTDTNENPLKMGMHGHQKSLDEGEKDDGLIEEAITKALPVTEALTEEVTTEEPTTLELITEPTSLATEPLIIEPELDTSLIDIIPQGPNLTAQEVRPNLNVVMRPHPSDPRVEINAAIPIPGTQEDSDLVQPVVHPSPHEAAKVGGHHDHGAEQTLPKDEMYDDQMEAAAAAENAQTTASPEDKIKQLEADMDALENQISTKLHSGEVTFNKDTEKALEWMLANMTKAAEEAAARQAQLDESKHRHEGPLHSGEIQYPKEDHSGEFSGLFGKEQVLDKRLFAAKVSPLDSPITLRKIQPDVQKQHYDSLKYAHAKVIKPIEYKVQSPLHHAPTTSKPNPEAALLEEDLKKLREEMAAMQSELVALQGDTNLPGTSIVQLVDDKRTTIGPNMKALDLELVPKAPRPQGGPTVPVVSTSGIDGEVFLLDVPQEKGEAQWSPWRDWGDCFCDKQVRTRICNYDSGFHSKGCQGKSFESRPCVSTRPCPAKIAAAKRLKPSTPSPLEVTPSEGLYTLAPPKGPRTGYAFKPNPLSVAISSIHSTK